MDRRRLIRGAVALAIAAPAVVRSSSLKAIGLTGADMGATGGGGFNPLSLITGAGAFYRADMGVTQVAGSASAWADQSSFGQNLASATANPTFSSTGFLGSFPGLTVGASNATFLNTTFTFSAVTQCSGFCLVEWKAASPDANFGRLHSFLSNGASSGDFNSNGSYTIDDGNAASYPSAARFTANNTQVAFNSINQNTAYLVGFVLDGVNMAIWINGSSSSTSAYGGSVGAAGSNKFCLGAIANNLTANVWNGTYAFTGITQKKMVTADWQNLKNWSNANWGTSF